mgnify:CR=1 FL=1
MRSIVISDIHLGIDDRIAENVKNRPLLIAFLDSMREKKEVDEVVINGDFLDQWFLPADYEHVTDSDEFYRQCAKNNQGVIDAFNRLIKDGIDVVYVPGNHDMTLSSTVLNEIMPGVTQVRDARGLGRYRTGFRGEVVIEHCHRYELFCAPDMLSNKDYMQYGEPMLPMGYFFALIGVKSFAEGMPDVDIDVPDVPVPDTEDVGQMCVYAYHKLWKSIIEDRFPVKESLDDRFIKVNVDGFQGQFSINDLIPKVTDEGISPELYKGFQHRWDEVQSRNLVPVKVDLAEQLKRMLEQELREDYAKKEYFDIDPSIDVVVFGHMHVPYYKEIDGYDRKKIYVNEGTWIDNNMDDPNNTAVFADIESDKDGTIVRLMKCVPKDGGFDIVPVKGDYVFNRDRCSWKARLRIIDIPSKVQKRRAPDG